MPPLAHVVCFTDPGCPFAWNAEPLLHHLQWRYGDQLTWETVMVGLAETSEDYTSRGYTPEFMHDSWIGFAAGHPMPIDTGLREHVSATGPACRAVVAAQLQAPDRAERLLRALRVRFFTEGCLDDPALIGRAARDAGIDPDALSAWTVRPDTQAEYEAQKARARQPTPATLAQDSRLAGEPGARRYTCPSLEVTRADGARLAAPGFQPWLSYELLFGNLLPEAAQRPDAETVSEVLDWAPFPLATAEVAQIRGIERETARQELLAAGASERPAGSDAFWTA